MKNIIKRIINWAARDEPNFISNSVSAGYPVAYHGSGSKTSNNSMANVKMISNNSPEIGFDNGINFIVYNANGGKLIQAWHYNKTEQRINNLYIIHDSDNLAEEISMILVKESLQR